LSPVIMKSRKSLIKSKSHPRWSSIQKTANSTYSPIGIFGRITMFSPPLFQWTDLIFRPQKEYPSLQPDLSAGLLRKFPQLLPPLLPLRALHSHFLLPDLPLQVHLQTLPEPLARFHG